MPGSAVKTYAIHPALGIARIGNAIADPTDPTTLYLSAESPYEVPNDGKPYKTSGKIKKQAQRFRIYEYEDGRATREITLGQADVVAITWTVHLANRKAALDTDATCGSPSRPLVVPPACYVPADTPPLQSGDPHYWPAKTRNAWVPAAQRAELCIDAGPQTVGGGIERQNLTGTITLFPSKPGSDGSPVLDPAAAPRRKAVALGRLWVEPGTGRLLVFGGDGVSEGLSKGQGAFSPLAELDDWGNNDTWYDDTADGSVQASVCFRDGSTLQLDQPEQRAWLITGVPRFAPGINSFTTLYDVARDAIHSPACGVPRPSFARDIHPILRSVSLLQWLSVRGSAGHGTGRGGNYLSQDRMQLVADNNSSPDSDPYKARNALFGRMRNPNEAPARDQIQKWMPPVSHDITTNPTHSYDIAAVTPLQYAMLQQWRDGDFDADGVPVFVPLDRLDIQQQPEALDRAALEGTAGTPFYPGIESWRIMRPAGVYAGTAALRISAATQPGDLTIGNALPWQADFLDCNDIWWPMQRPNEVTRDGLALQAWVPVAWIPDDNTSNYSAMVADWSKLGFVVSKDSGTSYEEVERSEGGPDP